MERLRGEGCAYWPGIARQIVRASSTSPSAPALQDFRAAPPEDPSEPGFSSRRAEWLNRFCYDWLLRGRKRTFSPFHRGVVTTYALEVGAAGEGDNRDHSFSAFRAARCPIHEILPIFAPNSELEVLFHSSVSAKQEDRLGFTVRGEIHSESTPNLLGHLGSDSILFSERALISLKVQPDFDSTMRRFESSRPSQAVTQPKSVG
jgi:hypothetical protein